MNTMLKTMYLGYQKAVIIGHGHTAVKHFSECAKISKDAFTDAE